MGATHTRKLSGFRLLDLSFVDRQNGYALGRFFGSAAEPVAPPVMALLRTSNGGRTWTTVGAPPAPVRHISFTTPHAGWAFGRELFVTKDGAGSWTEEHPGGRVAARAHQPVGRALRTARTVCGNRRCADVQTVDPLHGWAAAGKDVYRTTDGGRHWVAVRVHPSACGCVHRVDGR